MLAGFTHEQAGTASNFLCLSKGLSGGYLPRSVCMSKDTIDDAFYHVKNTHTSLHSHTGNALACCATLATVNASEQDKIIDANKTITNYLNQVSQLISIYSQVKGSRTCGMIWVFEAK